MARGKYPGSYYCMAEAEEGLLDFMHLGIQADQPRWIPQRLGYAHECLLMLVCLVTRD